MDSWDRLLEEMRRLIELNEFEPAKIMCRLGEYQKLYARIRALREGDEKRWEIVRLVEAALRISFNERLADLLREAREGRE